MQPSLSRVDHHTETVAARVLVADDDPIMLLGTATILRDAGYEVFTAKDGNEALAMLQSQDCDLVVADIGMPGNTRLELVQRMGEVREGLLAVLITGQPSVPTAIQSIQLPVAAYILKPFRAADLQLAVQAAVDRVKAVRTCRALRTRLDDWRRRATDVEQALLDPRCAAPPGLEALVELAVEQLVASIENLASVAKRPVVDRHLGERVGVVANPRELELVEVVRDAIHVLEKTKNSFRSKALGDLRHKLETAIGTRAPEIPNPSSGDGNAGGH